MGPDLPLETHGIRIKQLEMWREGLSTRLHNMENDGVALKMHAHEQEKRNDDVESRLRAVETSSLKSGVILAVVGAASGTAAYIVAELIIPALHH